jgi:hypothetical protein
MDERWLPVVGWESLYEVSDQGRVRSLRRDVILQPSYSNTGGYPLVWLPEGGALRYVHHLVLEAFVRPRKPGEETLHGDAGPACAALSNIRWGTSSENKLDQVRAGTHHEASKTHCDNGHEFTPENTYQYRGHRQCRTCSKGRVQAMHDRNRALGLLCHCGEPQHAKGLCQKHYQQGYYRSRKADLGPR